MCFDSSMGMVLCHCRVDTTFCQSPHMCCHGVEVIVVRSNDVLIVLDRLAHTKCLIAMVVV